MREFKVGDRVRWLDGPIGTSSGVVEKIEFDRRYPILVKFGGAETMAASFTLVGKYCLNDLEPALLHIEKEEKEMKGPLISMDKTYTYDGERGKVLLVDRKGHYPVLWMRESDGFLYDFRADGSVEKGGEVMLEEAKQVWWVNIYKDNVWPTKEKADIHKGGGRIACIKVTEGEGL